MSHKLVSALLVGAALVSGALAPMAAGAKSTGPVDIAEDPAGDWGVTVDPSLAPLGDALGQDLVGAAIEVPDKKTVNFIFKLATLPPSGGTPEATRYTWDFSVGKSVFNLDGKFTNYSRGACDALSGSCPPPRDPGLYPFQLKANCVTDAAANVTTCEEIAVVAAIFSAEDATITVPVPNELIKAKPGSVISGVNNGLFSGVVEAFPTAYLSSSNFPYDNILGVDKFVIPGGKKTKK